MRSSLASFSLSLLLVVLAFGGCSDTTAPAPAAPTDGGAAFDGSFDAGGGSFVMQRIEEPVPGQLPLLIELIGSNIQVDSSLGTVSVDVAIHNAGSSALYAPATIWLSRFSPPGIQPTNADLTGDSRDSILTAPMLAIYGYDYSDFLGGDGMLAPNESSQPKTWIFQDPGAQSFSFTARAEFGMEPGRPVIAGMLFSDDNSNGVRDEGEGPYLAGGVSIEAPDGTLLHAQIDETGAFRVRVAQAGLYRVRFVSELACPACWCETTPNPLEVFITPGPDGQLNSYEHADFGIYPGPCGEPTPPIRPVVLTDLPPDQIAQDSYQPIWAKLVGNTFYIRVGYSGCSPDHPFTLYAGRSFMESDPVQTWMVLQHDDRGEACLAYFENTLAFDLTPIQEAHIQDYGSPGKVLLRFRDFMGNEQEFTYDPVVILLNGIVTRIDDQVPSDGGVVIDLQPESGETVQLLFASLFTYPPPLAWRTDLYQVITSLRVGDQVTAKGMLVQGGISLVGLTILH